MTSNSQSVQSCGIFPRTVSPIPLFFASASASENEEAQMCHPYFTPCGFVNSVIYFSSISNKHTDYKIDLGKSLPIAEITIVSKFAILQEPLQRQNLEQMIAAHFFHSEAIISRELIKNEFEELFLLPENFLKLDTRCRTILDGG